MEREAWTDARLDDLANRMDAGFERVDRDIRDLRTEMNTRFIALETGLRGEIEALRQTMLRVGGGMIVGFLSVIAAVLTAS